MNTNKNSLQIISLDTEIMDCFESDEQLAVISGGKGLGDVIKAIKDLIGETNTNCHGCTTNDGC